MKTNVRPATLHTHEGGVAKQINPCLQLQRSVMSCLLWEGEFYEDGKSIAKRIEELIPKCPAQVVSDFAIEARNVMNLRHVPLLMVKVMAGLPKYRPLVAHTLDRVIQRPDELAEFVSLYWKDGRKPLSAQIKKGLAKAFTKFNAYSLAKYNRDGAVKLRDVLFLCHAKPKDAQQAEDWKQLANGTLPTPDTWEVALSSGADKKESWTRLINENKLGGLALLRNLRNMEQVGVERPLISKAIQGMSITRILPYRFIAAARHAPRYEPELEASMFRNTAQMEKLPGHTVLLVDVSGSMFAAMSSKSDLQRIDAACGLAMLLREVCDSVDVLTFSNVLAAIPPRRGFALRDAIVGSQPHSSTNLSGAISFLNKEDNGKLGPNDRLIVITDEQTTGRVPDPKCAKPYMINVASAKNGVGYYKWTHLDGFSEAIVNFITNLEK